MQSAGAGTLRSAVAPEGPRVSVVIPTYNRAELLLRALRSVLRAIAPGDEVVVVDDGSTDATRHRLAGLEGPIRYYRTEQRGAGHARNAGIERASHDWIAFLDSDDEWLPDHLDLHRTVLGRLPVLFTFGNFDIVEDDNPGIGRRSMQLASWTGDRRSWDEILGPPTRYEQLAPLPRGRAPFTVHVGSLYRAMLSASYVPTCTVLVRRDAAGEALRFSEDLPTYEDYECYIRLARAGRAAYLDCSTAVNHGHSGPRLCRVDKLTAATVSIRIFERNWGQDTAFLARDGQAYAASLLQHQRSRILNLALQGRTREARLELRGLPSASWKVRLLSRLPGPAARLVGQSYQRARVALSGAGRG